MVEVSDDEVLIWMDFHNFREQIHTIWTSGTGDYKDIARGQLVFLKEIFEHRFLFFKRHPFFIELSDKVEETIIGSHFVEYCFFTLYTLVLYHISFIFPIIYIYRLHLPVTRGCSVSWIYSIDMFWTEAKRTMITCRPLRMDSNGFMTIVTLKRFIMHYKNHTLWFSVIIKMVCKFSKKMYEPGFIKWVLLHETAERFCRIIKRYVVISFPNHDIKKSSVLIPRKDSFTISECIFFHDTIQKKIDIPDNTISPIFIGKGIFSVFPMVHKLISGMESSKDEYFIEKKKRKFLCKTFEKSVRLFGEIYKQARPDSR
ncbi:MAG: hypothetical protein ACD_78C00105G0002 [uncultured bacterium (gcode 4)]|uniref:Uncharacterized protein n=1 Tax=uncultured bacterium (gcode 4) TaxID=1234023 RepID=K1XYM7_9BACT|nr:MAG: hypothetical protein ACD_78C00105G0002 [uncultured bacterium (gcode 4)]